MSISERLVFDFLFVADIDFVLTCLFRYGYRGRDCRSNLHQIATGDTVYFIASVVVLVNLQDAVQRHYLGHTDDIRWYVAQTLLDLRLLVGMCAPPRLVVLKVFLLGVA